MAKSGLLEHRLSPQILSQQYPSSTIRTLEGAGTALFSVFLKTRLWERKSIKASLTHLLKEGPFLPGVT